MDGCNVGSSGGDGRCPDRAEGVPGFGPGPRRTGHVLGFVRFGAAPLGLPKPPSVAGCVGLRLPPAPTCTSCSGATTLEADRSAMASRSCSPLSWSRALLWSTHEQHDRTERDGQRGRGWSTHRGSHLLVPPEEAAAALPTHRILRREQPVQRRPLLLPHQPRAIHHTANEPHKRRRDRELLAPGRSAAAAHSSRFHARHRLGWDPLEYIKLTDQYRAPIGSPRVAAFFSRITREFSIILAVLNPQSSRKQGQVQEEFALIRDHITSSRWVFSRG